MYELVMQGMPGSDGIRRPPAMVILRSTGQYNPRPTLSPEETFQDEPATSYTAKGLQPFTEYEFKVVSENSKGATESSWISAKTKEAGWSTIVLIKYHLTQL